MEKTPMYAVVTPARPRKFQKVAWAALSVGMVALIVASVTAYVERRQMERVNALEETVLQMQIHMEQMLEFTHEYLEYEDDLEDPQEGGPYEELTVRGVVRKKRQAPPGDGVPIYEEAYGVDLTNRFNSEGLRLYESFGDTQGDPGSEHSPETTDSPIKPHHRISNLWVPKKRRQRRPSSSDSELSTRAELDDDYEDATQSDAVMTTRQGLAGGRRHAHVIQRTSRVKSLQGTGRGLRRQQKSRDHSNQNPMSVIFRDSFVKATDRNDGFSAAAINSVFPQTSGPVVVPQGPTVVRQGPQQLKKGLADALVSPYPRKKDSKKKRRPGKKQTRRGGRGRFARPVITMGHFVAAPANRSAAHVTDAELHDEWTPAAWMDKLGLNKKYSLRRGTVTVKESGLYYLYAQVLYESGRFGSGFQIMVDGIPVMECTLTPSQPSHSCHTSGTTYLPRNADVYVRDNESHMRSVRREENSFFGLIKLMDAPETAEKLILG